MYQAQEVGYRLQCKFRIDAARYCTNRNITALNARGEACVRERGEHTMRAWKHYSCECFCGGSGSCHGSAGSSARVELLFTCLSSCSTARGARSSALDALRAATQSDRPTAQSQLRLLRCACYGSTYVYCIYLRVLSRFSSLSMALQSLLILMRVFTFA